MAQRRGREIHVWIEDARSEELEHFQLERGLTRTRALEEMIRIAAEVERRKKARQAKEQE